MSRPILPNGTTARQASPPQLNGQRLAAIYARVSTTDQADHGFSLPYQLDATLAMAQREGYTVPDTYMLQDDYTGMSLNRPQLAQLRTLVQQGLVQAMYVYDLDRLSRRLAHQLLLAEELEQAGVTLRIVTMPEEAKTPESRMFTHMRGVFAEYERAKILERTRNGSRRRAHEGLTPGGRLLYGYTAVEGAFLVVPEEAALIQRIYTLYLDGYSTLSIAALLTDEGIPVPGPRQNDAPTFWHASTIANILHQKAYLGTAHYGKSARIASTTNPDRKTRARRTDTSAWIPMDVSAIIDQATFDAAQLQATRNRSVRRHNRIAPRYLFVDGRLKCGQCGHVMSGYQDRTGAPRYRCARKAMHERFTPHTGTRSLAASPLETLVWSAVEQVLNDPELLAAELARRQAGTSQEQTQLDRQRQEYQRQLARCDRGLTRWEAAYLDDAIDLADFKAKRAEVETRRASALEALTALDADQERLERLTLETTAIATYCARVRQNLTRFTLEEKQTALTALNITVTWHPDWTTPTITGSIPVDITTTTLPRHAQPQPGTQSRVSAALWPHGRCRRG